MLWCQWTVVSSSADDWPPVVPHCFVHLFCYVVLADGVLKQQEELVSLCQILVAASREKSSSIHARIVTTFSEDMVLGYLLSAAVKCTHRVLMKFCYSQSLRLPTLVLCSIACRISCQWWSTKWKWRKLKSSTDNACSNRNIIPCSACI
jgi:hypothetical protein